jgi:hypothetical protein
VDFRAKKMLATAGVTSPFEYAMIIMRYFFRFQVVRICQKESGRSFTYIYLYLVAQRYGCRACYAQRFAAVPYIGKIINLSANTIVFSGSGLAYCHNSRFRFSPSFFMCCLLAIAPISFMVN